MIQCLNIKIEGKVFKTGFRYFLKQKASLYHITGYVYYKSNNSVGLLAQGKPETLDNFLHHCRHGNNETKIESVQFKNIPQIAINTFEVVEEDEIVSINLASTNNNYLI